jgi:heme oxygenase
METLNVIRQNVAEGLQQSSAIKPFIEGNGDKEVYIHYLINVYKYAQHSAKVIALAAARCMKDHPKLGKYLLHHSEEEEGHDKWALLDLSELGVNQEHADRSYPVPACSAMIGYVHYLSTYANPVSLFGWLYVLESMGDDLGGTMAELINKNLNLDNKALRFVQGHGVNDIEHTCDIVNQLKENVTNPDDMRDIEHAAEVIADLYVRFFNEIGEK